MKRRLREPGAAPFLYAVLKGDFVANVRLSVEMAAQCDSGCLMAMSDDSNWANEGG